MRQVEEAKMRQRLCDLSLRGTRSNETERKRQTERGQEEAKIRQRTCDLSLRGTGSNEAKRKRLRRRGQEEEAKMIHSNDLNLRRTLSNETERRRPRRGKREVKMTSSQSPLDLYFSASSSWPHFIIAVLANLRERPCSYSGSPLSGRPPHFLPCQ